MSREKVDIDLAAKLVGSEYDVPPIYVYNDEDGSIGVEWIFENMRFGLNIGPKPDEHGWYVISDKKNMITASGPLEL